MNGEPLSEETGGELERHFPHSDILDEIYIRDPAGVFRQTEVVDGVTKMMDVILFADGSRLSIVARVPLPPMADMTSRRVHTISMKGEQGEKWDGGAAEVMRLARHATAARLFEEIAKRLDGMPEREKDCCPDCAGTGSCANCGGYGCLICRQTGCCVDCQGRGVVPRD
jgi:hypothetical protein